MYPMRATIMQNKKNINNFSNTFLINQPSRIQQTNYVRTTPNGVTKYYSKPKLVKYNNLSNIAQFNNNNMLNRNNLNNSLTNGINIFSPFNKIENKSLPDPIIIPNMNIKRNVLLQQSPLKFRNNVKRYNTNTSLYNPQIISTEQNNNNTNFLPSKTEMTFSIYSKSSDKNIKILQRGPSITDLELNTIISSSQKALENRDDPLSTGITKRIKEAIGGEWFVYACLDGLKGYDFNVSAVSGNDFLSFKLNKFLIQVCRLNESFL